MHVSPPHFRQHLLIFAFGQQGTHEKAAREVKAIIEGEELSERVDGPVIPTRVKESLRTGRADRERVGIQLHRPIEGRGCVA
jgi:hypothetical protein